MLKPCSIHSTQAAVLSLQGVTTPNAEGEYDARVLRGRGRGGKEKYASGASVDILQCL